MKGLAKFTLSVALIAPFGAHADTPPPTPAPSESQRVERGSYINKNGIRVHSPAHTKNGELRNSNGHRLVTPLRIGDGLIVEK
jgi:hypothetical protein